MAKNPIHFISLHTFLYGEIREATILLYTVFIYTVQILEIQAVVSGNLQSENLIIFVLKLRLVTT